MDRLKISLLIVMTILATSCETNRWAEHEQKMIDDYIKTLGDTTYVLYPSGLYYIELIPGTGAYPTDLDTVFFKYKAAFTDYVQFDTNDPYTTPYKYIMGKLDDVVAGVDEGLRYMKEGGTSRFLTPSSLAWGFEGLHEIVAGYTPILWTIELDSIKPYSGKK
jgi:FKBP-type peptidyl-prolyl cis-trans isomerase